MTAASEDLSNERVRPAAPGRYLLLVGVAAIVVILDQITKSLALSRLADGPVDLIAGALTLRLTYNSGGAFGLMQGMPVFFLVATIIVVIVILAWTHRIERTSWVIPLGMVLGGGLGNLVDRLVRDTPGVIDFIDLHVWPVFNLADSSIVVGVVALLLLNMRSDSAKT
jgi:signal peptidase II